MIPTTPPTPTTPVADICLDTCIAIDLEMTSARPEAQEVIEIAAIKFRGDRVLGSWSRLIKPSIPLPYNVQVLTGIRPSDLARAPALADVADQLARFVGDLPLVAHTVSADVGCLQRQGVPLANPQIDTFELGSLLLPRMPNYSLAALAEHFGVPFPRQHRATADALVTRQVFLALLAEARALEPSVLQEISRLVAPFAWPLKAVFRDAGVAAERARAGGLGASIRQQLAAKGADDDLPIEVLLLAPPDEPPLQPAPERHAVPAALAAALEPGGAAAGALPGYEPRPAQRALLAAVADAFDRGESLLAEAAPGTGRALAYMLPAAALALAHGEPVVVATATPARQEQLQQRELPALQRLLPAPVRVALVRPRESYLCLRRWTALRRHADLTLTEALTLVKTLVWLPTTRTGDLAELNLTDAERAVWQRISAGDETCAPAACRYARQGTCFLARASRAAASAHVVLASQAVVLADLRAANRVLPPYRYLVVDEADRLEDEATAALGRQPRLRDFDALVDALAGPDGLAAALGRQRGELARALAAPPLGPAARSIPELADAARAAAVALFAALALFLREGSADRRGGEQRVRVTKGLRGSQEWQRAAVAAEALSGRLDELQGRLDELARGLSVAPIRRTADLETLVANLGALRGAAARLAADATGPLLRADPEHVCWLSSDAAGELAIRSAPVHVGPALAGELFAPLDAAVLTSNALTVAGSFDYVRGRLGLDGAAAATFGEPDESARSTLLYLPVDLPEPEQPVYQDRLQRALLDLCLATRGRALVLFTSHGQLRQAWSAIHRPLADRGVLVLGQGVDGSSRRNLLQTFQTNAQTVLLGTGAFWDSVELPAGALRVLVVTRLPFAPPVDPVVAARTEGLRDPLGEYTLPRAILRLRQGVDRLARGVAGRGVVALLDRRVQTKSYGQVVLDSLPPFTVRSGPVRDLPGEAARWLAES